jgi:hypothetical protein
VNGDPLADEDKRRRLDLALEPAQGPQAPRGCAGESPRLIFC